MELPETDATAALDAFTLAVMASCGQLSLIINHMHRFAAEHGPGEEPVPAVLHSLLRDVLQPLADEHGVADIATTAQMLDSATQVIGDELFVVDLSRFEEGD
jgi:hypothetical protein